ncbi:hypothetical protein TNCT_622421 [Trichonephila clavata]|uniref:Uncharacterized protein n=1 Tax=Trichonephila clavata TaxID=2740835 RepID=A0A8X6HG66_TRICU|nr:hypothetical protein TNCT_622421 [Trichonephila clavata]
MVVIGRLKLTQWSKFYLFTQEPSDGPLHFITALHGKHSIHQWDSASTSQQDRCLVTSGIEPAFYCSNASRDHDPLITTDAYRTC